MGPKNSKPLLTCYTLTNSYLLEQIEYLVQHLPEVHFEIAAYTYMAVELLRLSQYPNVSLYPNTYPLLIEQQLQQVDLYLDINHFDKIPLIYELIDQAGISIFAFENTKEQGQTYQAIFSHEHPEEMVVAIRRHIEENRSNRKGSDLL